MTARFRVLEREGMVPLPYKVQLGADRLNSLLKFQDGWSFSGFGRHSKTWEQFIRERFELLRDIVALRRQAARHGRKVVRRINDDLRPITRQLREEVRRDVGEFVAMAAGKVSFKSAPLHAGIQAACWENIHRRVTYLPILDRLAIMKRELAEFQSMQVRLGNPVREIGLPSWGGRTPVLFDFSLKLPKKYRISQDDHG